MNYSHEKEFSFDLSQVNNMLDESHSARDFHSVVKPAIDDLMGREVTFDILFHNSEHQATLLRYGVKKSIQVSRQSVFFTVKSWSFISSGLKKWKKKNWCICLCVTDREDLWTHHALLEEAVRWEKTVKNCFMFSSYFSHWRATLSAPSLMTES